MSKKMGVFIWAILTFATASIGWGASSTIDINVSSGMAHLVFADYSGIELDLKPFSGADAIDKAAILFTHTNDRISFLVIQLTGPTRVKGGSGYCGAGQEENLLWMKLSSTRVLDARTVLFSSCAFSIEPADIEITKDKLEANFISYSEKKQFILREQGRI